jgi:hypothetical protein
MKKIEHLFKGFLELNEKERQEFLKIVSEYKDYPNTTEKELRKIILEKKYDSNIDFGPTTAGCPCCGK